jgi:hypothetical protein
MLPPSGIASAGALRLRHWRDRAQSVSGVRIRTRHCLAGIDAFVSLRPGRVVSHRVLLRLRLFAAWTLIASPSPIVNLIGRDANSRWPLNLVRAALTSSPALRP